MPDVLILDNYDSFTWNLVQAVEALGARCEVRRSDRMTLEEVEAMAPRRIILSPGPFGPERTGICADVVRRFAERVPVLGVCLGMQVIATVGGARVRPSGRPVHGKASPVCHDGHGVLRGLPSPFLGARYHSLQIDPVSMTAELEVTAWTGEGIIMGCRLRGTLAEGVLFHPESFLTEHGTELLGTFLRGREDVV
ncbi:MAG TPA: aminodeoxychorismate/anthranilate synthase component II [Bryobacteraceae bacterium]|jgi:anthranilate synthase/aminodeoxychorismate synthase-like glutamine amidotransferase